MRAIKFIRELSDLYFSEKDKAQNNSRRCWSFVFTGFFLLYALQIYAVYVDFQAIAERGAHWIKPDDFWQIRTRAIYLSGIVLLGIFIRFCAAWFRGKWAIRCGELAESIAAAAFYRHFEWTRALYPTDPRHCYETPSLIGIPEFFGALEVLFFFGWGLCKIVLIIALMWKIVRK